MKKILVLSASARKGGNTDLLCDEFIRGAESIIVAKTKCANFQNEMCCLNAH